MVYGKVPPQAKELEEAVLGAIMLEKKVNAIGCADERSIGHGSTSSVGWGVHAPRGR